MLKATSLSGVTFSDPFVPTLQLITLRLVDLVWGLELSSRSLVGMLVLGKP